MNAFALTDEQIDRFIAWAVGYAIGFRSAASEVEGSYEKRIRDFQEEWFGDWFRENMDDDMTVDYLRRYEKDQCSGCIACHGSPDDGGCRRCGIGFGEQAAAHRKQAVKEAGEQ